ncbi:membrane protein [Philodulcilactobacillus myokoensis]|uniref:Membrane protein n=1 Tax=Philodulcilactobacillus myokoensis TaxID=2929573 RepID=A0A9W6B243_9LACO|nr:DUF1129 family protein [Philodulcilactobacillus myokoensis]GLB47253.1 membrane protein [Philodulcilactobacillus myokoensis]
MNKDEEIRQHNASVKQHHESSSASNERASFDDLGLTKRNADFVFRFNRGLGQADSKLSPEQKTTIVKQMVDELLNAQKTGQTAKNLYGSVQDHLQAILHPKPKPADMKKNYWPNAIYNFFVFLAVFALIYGFSSIAIKNPAESKNGGFLTIFLPAIAAGLGMPKITSLFLPNVKYKTSGIIRFLEMIGLFAIWIVIFYATVLLPISLNPELPPMVNIIIGLIAVAAAFYINIKYDVNSIFGNRRR